MEKVTVTIAFVQESIELQKLLHGITEALGDAEFINEQASVFAVVKIELDTVYGGIEMEEDHSNQKEWYVEALKQAKR